MSNQIKGAFPLNSVITGSTLRNSAKRSRIYVIFIMPRSGSTWLTELAMNSNGLGAPQEWFNEGFVQSDTPALGCLTPRNRGIFDINQYIDAIVDEGNGVSGVELSILQALMLRELVDQHFDLSWLNASFYLRRYDLAAQAVSLYRSAMSGRFHSYQCNPLEMRQFNTVEYDHEKLVDTMRYLIDCEDRFDALFTSCNIQPTMLYYEHLQNDPLSVLRRLAAAVGSPSPLSIPKTSLTLMRDKTSAAWRQRLVSKLPSDIVNSVNGPRVSQDPASATRMGPWAACSLDESRLDI